jgi:carboxyl-terminal processing protease
LAVDVVGMRLDVVKKIKGPKGTEVRLTVKKLDGTIKLFLSLEILWRLKKHAKSSVVTKMV